MSKEQNTQYNVVMPEGVPPALAGLYAAESVNQAVVRAKAEEERHIADREKRERIAATLAQFEQDAIKREEAEAKQKRERERERFIAQQRALFLEANPGASESDWFSNRDPVIAAAMRERAAGRGPVDLEKQRLIATGRYGF
ncbi:MAG: hypothetical protein ABJB97_11160 [Acidobacteriota bacterium]